MIYIKRSSEEGIDIRKNKKTQVITSNYDVSVKSISRTETLLNDPTRSMKVTFLNVNYTDNIPFNLSKSMEVYLIQIKFQVIDYDLLRINEFIVYYGFYATDNFYVSQNGRNLKSVIMPRHVKDQLGNFQVYKAFKMNRNEDPKRKSKFSEKSYLRKRSAYYSSHTSQFDDQSSLLLRNIRNIKEQYFTTDRNADIYNIKNVKSSNSRKLLERELKMQNEEKRNKNVKRMYNNSKRQKKVTENSTTDYDYYIDESLESDDKDEYENDYEKPEISSHWYDYEEKLTTESTTIGLELSTLSDADYFISQLSSTLTSTLPTEVTETSTADYDYFIDDTLESDDKDYSEYDYEEPEISTYWYDYEEEFTTTPTTIDLEQLQIEETYTSTSEEIVVTPSVTLLSIIETTRTTELRETTLSFVITETSTFVTTVSITELTTTEITETLLPAVTTKFTIYTTISPSTESTTELTTITMEYTSTLVSTTEVTITETLPFLTIEETTTWIENITEPSLFEESEIITTITFTSTELITTPYTTFTYTPEITTTGIITNVTTEEFPTSTETLPTSTKTTYTYTVSSLETSTAITESETYFFVTTTATFVTYDIGRTIPEIFETTTPLPFIVPTEITTLTEEISEPTSTTPLSILSIPEESTFPVSETTFISSAETTYFYTVSSLETSTAITESETYFFVTTTATFVTYDIDRTVPEIFETTTPLPFTVSIEITTLTEEILEPTSTTPLSILSIPEESTSPVSETTFISSTETTYIYVVSSVETSTAVTESETYFFVTTTVTFVTYDIDRTVPEIFETTTPLPFTVSIEITTLTEEILEPTSTTPLSILSIPEESTSPVSETTFISSTETTYIYTVSSLKTSTAITESETYFFVTTTATFVTYYIHRTIPEILETTTPLPFIVPIEITTLTEEILEPTSTTPLSILSIPEESTSPVSETTFISSTETTYIYTVSSLETSTAITESETYFFVTTSETLDTYYTDELLDLEITIIPSTEITFTTLEEEISTLITTPVIDVTQHEKTSFIPFSEAYTSIPISFLRTDTTIHEKLKAETDSSEYEEFYDEEYGKDYKESYEEDEYEDEEKASSIWYEYEEEKETTMFDRKTTKFKTTKIIEKETSKITENKTVPIVSLTTKPILTEMETISTREEYETSTTISETIKDFERTLTTKSLTPSVPTIEEFTLTSDKVLTYTTEHLEWWAEKSTLKKHDHTGTPEIEPKTKLDVTLPKFIVSPDETTIDLFTEKETITQTKIFPTMTDSSIYYETTTDEETKLFVTEGEETELYFTTSSDFVSLLTTDDILDDKIKDKDNILKELITEIKILENQEHDSFVKNYGLQSTKEFLIYKSDSFITEMTYIF
uniref:uncharacterized protein LOC127065793 n=1 Tax=Vespula vulgaris TaxID=7454 RepID=UPI00223BF399|nr:uncharacterized protein LOC127065793 [Vespula vulgaris]